MGSREVSVGRPLQKKAASEKKRSTSGGTRDLFVAEREGESY